MLRTSMAVIDYPTDNVSPSEVPELQGKELEDIRLNMYLNEDNADLMHSPRTELDEGMRVPIRLAYLLKKTLNRHKEVLNEEMHPMVYTKLVESIDKFMTGYYG